MKKSFNFTSFRELFTDKRILAVSIIAIILLFVGGGICFGTCGSTENPNNAGENVAGEYSNHTCGGKTLYCVSSEYYQEQHHAYLYGCSICNSLGCEYDGITCDSDCLQCTWYPSQCDFLACDFMASVADCNWLCNNDHTPLVICGWDLCLGATTETGWEYQEAYDKLNKEKKDYFEPAIRDVDYTIDSIQLLYDGGLLDTDKFWEMNDFDFEKFRDQYFNLDFKSRFYVTIQYTVINDLAGIEFEQTLEVRENERVGIDHGNRYSYTRTAANGHSVSSVLNNKLDYAEVLTPGKYAAVIEFELDALDVHFESLSDIVITAFKLREE